jgi:hypothetical protein
MPTRLKRKSLRNKLTAQNRLASIKRLNAKPVIKFPEGQSAKSLKAAAASQEEE